ncbi:hypothetical protein [Gorillibacterium massiliense]|uniref:hypothetical protein n=1 Tax=Gorillibacterium massiliense TaxID=1280390 RepID=UPI0004B0AC4A|nr:hypothetical protein [Gorillibacterium massiliense]
MQAVLSGKTDVLRKHEQLIFSIAFYLLKDTDRAMQTSENALKELAGDSSFLNDGEELQREKARSVAMRFALMNFYTECQ